MSKNILVLEKSTELNRLYTSLVEITRPEAKVYTADVPDRARSLLVGDQEWDTIICSDDFFNGELPQFLATINGLVSRPNVFLLGEPEVNDCSKLKNFSLFCLRKNQFRDLTDQLQIRQNLEGGESSDEYLALSPYVLSVLPKVSFEIYARLGKDQFTRISYEGIGLDDEGVKGYLKDNFKSLYVGKETIVDIVQQIHDELEKLLVGDDSEITLVAVAEVVDAVVRAFGIDEKTQELIDSTTKTVAQEINMSETLPITISNQMNESSSYLFGHSSALAYLSCCIASQVSYKTNRIFEKLVYCSFLHDHTVIDERLAKIHDREQLESLKSDYLPEQFDEYLNHPILASQAVAESLDSEDANEIVEVILQHHEKPDGSGFPNGIDFKGIAPLTVIFVIAEYFLDQMIANNYEIDWPKALSQCRMTYSQGLFGNVIDQLSHHFKQSLDT